MNVTLKVNGAVVAQGQVPAACRSTSHRMRPSTSAAILISPVSLDYFDQAPFAFNGTIGTTKIAYPKK